MGSSCWSQIKMCSRYVWNKNKEGHLHTLDSCVFSMLMTSVTSYFALHDETNLLTLILNHFNNLVLPWIIIAWILSSFPTLVYVHIPLNHWMAPKNQCFFFFFSNVHHINSFFILKENFIFLISKLWGCNILPLSSIPILLIFFTEYLKCVSQLIVTEAQLISLILMEHWNIFLFPWVKQITTQPFFFK